MTIEEKAKAYDKALERAKALNADNLLSDDAIEEIFPKLKESEDEKIRKEIITYFKLKEEAAQKAEYFQSERGFSRWIAWLEKQKPVDISEIEMKRHNEGYIRGVHDAYDNINQARSILNQLRKEKPKIEQKPTEWSKEDSKNLKEVVIAITMSEGHTLDEKEQLEDWLKSLKDRVGCEANCTTTKEWSEEDEKMLDFAITVITTSTATTFKKEDCVDWLKSLRPQNLSSVERNGKNWKPSERQMDALQTAIEESVGEDYHDGLVSLDWNIKKYLL